MPVEEIERRFQHAVVQEAEFRADDPHSWASEEVSEALARLQESFRTIILMVDVDELSYEEAAKALDVPIGTVRGLQWHHDSGAQRTAQVGVTTVGYFFVPAAPA